MASKTIPKQGDTTTPFWRTDPDKLDNYRSTEKLPEETDIVIIGAGYAGASTAHHLLDQSDRSSTPSIVILEARQACSGATGRNGGHLKPDAYRNISSIAAEHGFEAAAEVATFEAEHVFAIKSLVEKENIDCDYVVTRAFDVQFSDENCRQLKAGYDKLVENGSEATAAVQYTSYQNAEAISGVKGARGCFSYTAGAVWPYKLIVHILGLAISQGVNLQTNTPVTQVSEEPDADGRWTVHTSRGPVKAKYVVFASNAYTAGIAPQYAGRIIPVRGICSRIVAPKPEPFLPNTYILRWNSWEYDYLIPRPDGSIIVGGARRDFLHDLASWYDTTDDSQLIEPAAHYFDGYMQRHFRGWESSGAYTDRVWTGIMGYSADSLPHVGNVPGKPGQLIVAGFTGHGMPRAFLSAKGVAEMILKGVDLEETGVPNIFKTTEERLKSKANVQLAAHKAAVEARAKL